MKRVNHKNAVARLHWVGATLGMAAALAVFGIVSPPAFGSQAAVGLGTAAPFAVLAGTTITNTGPTVISGDIGVDPGSAITGFPPGILTSGTQYSAGPTSSQAESDLTSAYLDAAAQSPTATVSSNLGGQTLAPGVYNASSALALTGTLTLNAENNPAAVFIFQAGSTLITGTNSTVALVGGAQACNVFWQVGSSATLGTGTSFAGSILALTSITVQSGATLSGRALARNGQVSLDANTVTVPACSTASSVTTIPGATTTLAPTTTTTTTATLAIAKRSRVVLSTTASSHSITLGASVRDLAHVKGNATGHVPTGKVAFYECGPASSKCTLSAGTSLGSLKTLSNGVATSPAFTPKSVGTYCFSAAYKATGSAYRDASEVGTASDSECFVVVAHQRVVAPPKPSSPPPVVIPPVHTGEPWAGWPYWLLVGTLGTLGITLAGAPLRRRFARDRVRR